MSTHRILAKVIVIGASRGIGLELAKQLHAKYPDPNAVIATMRKPDPSLLPKDVLMQPLDITSEESIKAFAALIESVDTLIVNAAVGKSDSLIEADKELLNWYLQSNVVGVHSIVRNLIPALLKGSDTRLKRLIYISSSDASMQRQIGGKIGLHGPYSVSKAAGNMLMIQYYNALQEHRVCVGLIHPGWVATDMGNTAGDGGMPVEKSVKGIVDIIGSKLTYENSPLFVDWEGRSMPW